jgi:predicted nicotinamide N-methyase
MALINSDFPTGPLDAATMHAVLANPAYWAFCWGSGLALAQFLHQDPRWVAGKSVVDLGSGSGVAAIAACKAGAARVIACDIDPDARLATRTNAQINQADIQVTARLPDSCDVMLMADVLYDKSNLSLLATAQACADEVIVADSRVTILPDSSYRELTTIDCLTQPNLGEFDEFRTAHIFHSQRDFTSHSAESSSNIRHSK